MTVRDLLFAVADLWMIAVGLIYGVKFIRNHQNYLIGLEWIIMGVSGTNFLVYGMVKAGHDSPMFHIAYFLDAFSRSIGFTVILVLGLLAVTHRYTPSIAVEVGAFAVGAVLGVMLSEFAEEIGTPGKVFFLVAALATSLFLCYFAWRLWAVGERIHAVSMGVATALNMVIASIYDFWPIPGDDANHTIFYTLALFTWGLAMLVIYKAYAAFDAHNRRVDVGPNGIAAPATTQGAEFA